MNRPGWRLWFRSRRQQPTPSDSDSPAPYDPHHPPDSQQPEGPELEQVLLGPADIDLIARLVKAEAEGEPYLGQVAVAAVVLNRLRSPQFPDDVRRIIYQRGQFETVSNGRINEPAGEIYIAAVEDALSGLDPTGGALFFFNLDLTSNRFVHSLPVVAQIGRHTFA